MKVAAIVPTCRGFTVPKQTVDVDWYIVHDGREWPVVGDAINIVAPDPGMYGQRCDSIRSAGFLRAYRDGASHILTVDDDCTIPPDWAAQHVYNLEQKLPTWTNTMEMYPARGMPRADPMCRVAISHGLWDGVPDLDAVTQAKVGPVYVRHGNYRGRIYPPFPQSAMNLGFTREVTPVMYQPFQGEGAPYDRFADIWGGLFAQKVLSTHHYAFVNGGAYVYHQRASDLGANMTKEAPGMKVHDEFWRYVWYKQLDIGNDIMDTYHQLAFHVADFPHTNSYFSMLAKNMHHWIGACRSTDAADTVHTSRAS